MWCLSLSVLHGDAGNMRYVLVIFCVLVPVLEHPRIEPVYILSLITPPTLCLCRTLFASRRILSASAQGSANTKTKTKHNPNKIKGLRTAQENE